MPNTFDQELGSEIPVRVVGVGDSITAALVVRQGQILSTSTSTATVVVPLVTSTVLIDGVSNPTITIAQVSPSSSHFKRLATFCRVVKLIFV